MNILEEIVANFGATEKYSEFHNQAQISKSMSDYAKITAEGFAEWLFDEGYEGIGDGSYWTIPEHPARQKPAKSTSALFDDYIKSLKD